MEGQRFTNGRKLPSNGKRVEISASSSYIGSNL